MILVVSNGPVTGDVSRILAALSVPYCQAVYWLELTEWRYVMKSRLPHSDDGMGNDSLPFSSGCFVFSELPQFYGSGHSYCYAASSQQMQSYTTLELTG